MPEHRHRLLRAVQTNSRLRAQTSGRATVATPAFDLGLFPPQAHYNWNPPLARMIFWL